MNRRSLPWPQAWQQALYGTDGFYRSPDGPQAHFSTSVAGIPHASAVMARAVVALARRLGRSTVVDLGAGRGSLIDQVRRTDPGLRCIGVDIVPAPSTLAPGVQWWVADGGGHLPAEVDGCRAALVVAHEWLDVVPTTVARRGGDGTWRAGEVDVHTGEESWVHPVTDVERAWLERWTDPDTEVAEVGVTREQALGELCRRLRDSSVLVVDYGHLQQHRPPQGSLLGYRRGETLRPIPDGSMDLTAHVAVDALCASVSEHGVVRARQWEALCDLLGPGGLEQNLARSRPAEYLHQLAEQGARRELCQRGGLGDFWWVLVGSPARLAR